MTKEQKEAIDVLIASALESIKTAKDNKELSNAAIVELLHVEDAVRKLFKLLQQ